MERFANKIVIATGGAAGIGRASVERFVAEGAQVLIADFNRDQAEMLCRELGEATSCYALDVTDADAVERMVSHTIQTFGRVDVLFNNVGLGSSGRTPDLSIQDWHRVIDVNLSAVFYTCKFTLPEMIRAGGGSIINTASISGLGGDYSFTAYNAAKAGVINYTRAMALDHGKDGIRVNAVCPGFVETGMSSAFTTHEDIREAFVRATPLGRPGEPDDIAGVVAFLASDDARYITGQTIVVDGGLSAGSGIPNTPRIAREARQTG